MAVLSGARLIEPIPKLFNSLPFMTYRYEEGKSDELFDAATDCAIVDRPSDSVRINASKVRKRGCILPPAILIVLNAVPQV